METVDKSTGEIMINDLPTGYESGNQSLAVNLARAEVDQQVMTARAFPRSISRAVQNIMTLATLDEETAAECIYALPRGGKPIKGPSIRFAEIISACWGNNRTGARVVHVDKFEKFVEAEGVYHDLETNVATTMRVRRSIKDRHGNLFSEDMIIVTGNAACSIAKRNAIIASVAKGVWAQAYRRVEGVIMGDIKTLSVRRGGALKAFAQFGVTPDQVFAALEVGGIDDITLEHLPTLGGMHAALKSGESTVEEMFPKEKPADTVVSSTSEALDKLSERAKATAPRATKAKEPPAVSTGASGGGAKASPAGNAASPKPSSNSPPEDGEDDAAGRKMAILNQLEDLIETAMTIEELDAKFDSQEASLGAEGMAADGQAVYERHCERINSLPASGGQDDAKDDGEHEDDPPFEADPPKAKPQIDPALLARAKQKTERGEHRFGLYVGGLSIADQEALAPIMDELLAEAKKAS